MANLRITVNPINRCTMSCKYCVIKEDQSINALTLEKVELGLKEIINLFEDEENKITVHFNSKDVFLCWDSLVQPFIEKYSNLINISIHSNGILLTEEKIDFLSLHLGFYLASWGMMRGSTELLDKDYKIHIPAVKVILKYYWY